MTKSQRAREALVALAGLAAGLGAIWLVSNRTAGPDELNSGVERSSTCRA